MYPYKVEREQASSLACSKKSSNPIHEVSTLMTELPPKDPTSKCRHMGISVLAYEFGGNAFSPFPL
jgi:hypothetical protein